MPAVLETIILLGEEIEEAIHSGKNLRAALTGSLPSGSEKTAESPARLNRSEARATSQVPAEKKTRSRSSSTSSKQHEDPLEEREGKESDDRRYCRSRLKRGAPKEEYPINKIPGVGGGRVFQACLNLVFKSL